MSYYVYVHRQPDGRIFYVGKGCRGRVANDDNRTDRWREVASEGYVAEVAITFDCEDDALLCERDLIDWYGLENLTNVQSGHHAPVDHSSPRRARSSRKEFERRNDLALLEEILYGSRNRTRGRLLADIEAKKREIRGSNQPRPPAPDRPRVALSY